MSRRLDLQLELETLLGTRNVYFQPPPSVQMSYPCIVYERVRINTDFANNKPYKLTKIYQLTYIDKDPDSDMPDKIGLLPCCVFERQYKSNEMYHNVFRLAY